MAYTKNTWRTGDIVSSQKLNHMEDGIANAGGTLVIGGFSFYNDAISGTSDKTWQEIDNALAEGARCVVVIGNGGHRQLIVEETTVLEGNYGIVAGMFSATTTSADGYPTTNDGGDDGGEE